VVWTRRAWWDESEEVVGHDIGFYVEPDAQNREKGAATAMPAIGACTRPSLV